MHQYYSIYSTCTFSVAVLWYKCIVLDYKFRLSQGIMGVGIILHDELWAISVLSLLVKLETIFDLHQKQVLSIFPLRWVQDSFLLTLHNMNWKQSSKWWILVECLCTWCVASWCRGNWIPVSECPLRKCKSCIFSYYILYWYKSHIIVQKAWYTWPKTGHCQIRPHVILSAQLF